MRFLVPILLSVLIIIASYFFFRQNAKDVPVGIVVPHHDMVAATRAAYFKEISSQIEPDTIVVISPDHFNRANDSIVASDNHWDTSVGEISPNIELINDLELTIHNEPFTDEHGITSLLKDIRYSFPSSTLVPILIQRSATFEEVVSFTKHLYQECPDCFLVASVDFSHTNDAMIADVHDILSKRGLYTVDAETLYKEAEVDSPESLVALTTWATLHNYKKFTLFSHTNSGILSNTKSGEMTTHIIGGYFSGEPDRTDDSVTFMAAGDLSLSRGVHGRIQNQPNLLEKIGERFFWGVDVSLVNFEGYFSNELDPTAWEQDPPLFPVPSTYATYLEYLKINSVNIANNHTQDGGDAGFQNTIAVLKEHNIDIIGNTSNVAESSIKIKRVGDLCVAFIGVYTHEPFSNLIESINQLSDSDCHTVVYAHWGIEMSEVSSAAQQAMARDWIDAGADLVVGSHPHVVQDFEVYKGKPIVYSLGNFIFDQNFSTEVQVGAVLGGKFEENSLSLFVVPVHTYIEPYVLDDESYTNYVETWTKNWTSRLQDNGYFMFELEAESL